MWDGNENVKIDVAHAELITGLVLSSKPVEILELGLGGGRSVDAVLKGLQYNQLPYNYTLVDNWSDWGYRMPEGVSEKYNGLIEIITSDEKAFVFSCNKKYDFIISDADHGHTEQWFEYVYDNLLDTNGILIYHDVNLFDNDYPNLRQIYYTSKNKGYSYKLFNKNSLPGERCQRGLMVIFKNA
jgi:predicted O-methyltransferase YrrM